MRTDIYVNRFGSVFGERFFEITFLQFYGASDIVLNKFSTLLREKDLTLKRLRRMRRWLKRQAAIKGAVA